MKVELRSVPDCPNLAPARAVLTACLAEAGITAEIVEVVGDYPSPSVLIDGVDVMGDAGTGPACRLDLPTAAAIHAALRAQPAHGSTTGAVDRAMGDCCAGPGDAIRADRPDRAAALPAGPRHVHRQILEHFATTGQPPSPADIDAYARTVGLSTAVALAALTDGDLIAFDAGRLIAAYPFSPTPTAHRVDLDGITVHAMCAIDALGIAFMLGTDTTITSRDPHTGEQVTITTTTNGRAQFTPASAVVVYAASKTIGRSVDTCCSTINFFTSNATATAWTTAHPGLQATVLDQAHAVALGRDIFGPLLQPAIGADPGRP
ncbi:alkylmercury lyase family protein [Catellatospora methionotrophica]|uniref:alkylmercury lyase family protein n=1 Tax=Catellatospora methionotrophica TaxID=121620 RepID=UPI0033D21F61